MMLKLKNITMKNFMSVGAVTQTINIDEHGLTLVLGDNIDQGSNGNRNGVGKSVLIHAISFALFGTPMTKIKVDNLVNKTNNKNMVVTIEFEKNNHKYRIERGRKPTLFKFFVDDVDTDKIETDQAQGNSRDSNKEIEKIIGISPQLFKHIIALSTKTVPFLSEGAQKQRDIIEELLCITQLSEKAEILKDNMKDTKREIEREEMRHKMITENNEKTKRTIDQITIKSNGWEEKHTETSDKLVYQIEKIMEIDIDVEIQKHKDLESYNVIVRSQEEERREHDELARSYESAEATASRDYSATHTEMESLKASVTLIETQEQTLSDNHTQLLEHRCPTCGQDVHDDKHDEMIKKIEEDIEALVIKKKGILVEIEAIEKIVIEKEKKYQECKSNFGALTFESKIKNDIIKPDTFHYDDLHDAYEHKKNLDNLISMFEKETESENPFVDQIKTIEENNLQTIDYSMINELVNLLNHQDFLFKMLTKKDSNIRMQIIDQNLSFLNHRLDYYLKQIGLPHQVVFLSDLSVDITKNGQNFDFDNLSGGESIRLVLSLSWAFRDMYEALSTPINLMFIDELIDTGLDSNGSEAALAILKHMTRENKKNIFLISHKDEFVARVSNVLIVEKENNFTNYRYDTDLQI